MFGGITGDHRLAKWPYKPHSGLISREVEGEFRLIFGDAGPGDTGGSSGCRQVPSNLLFPPLVLMVPAQVDSGYPKVISPAWEL